MCHSFQVHFGQNMLLLAGYGHNCGALPPCWNNHSFLYWKQQNQYVFLLGFVCISGISNCGKMYCICAKWLGERDVMLWYSLSNCWLGGLFSREVFGDWCFDLGKSCFTSLMSGPQRFSTSLSHTLSNVFDARGAVIYPMSLNCAWTHL